MKCVLTTAIFFLASILASAQQKFEYVYTGGSALNGFEVSSTTGGLVPLPGTPFSGPAHGALAISPAGDFLFAGQAGITVKSINAKTGLLSAVAGSPFSQTLELKALVVSLNGSYLYAGASGFIYTFAIDGNVGAVTPIGTPVSLNGLQATSFAVSPTGKFLYVGTSSSLLGFAVNPQSGALSPITFDVTGTSPVISSNGFLYTIYGLLGGFGTEIGAYSIDPTSGMLTPVGGSPFTATNTGTFLLAVDRSGKFLYQTAGVPASSVAGYAINTTTGAIEGPVPGSPFATAAGFPIGLIVDRSDQFVYTTYGVANDLSGFTMNATTGSLATIAGLLASANPYTIAVTVPKPPSTATLKALAIKPANPTVQSASTSTEQFFAVGEYSDGSQRFLTASVTWTSLNPGVATISNTPRQQGLAAVIGNGSTEIMATLSGLSASTLLTVQ